MTTTYLKAVHRTNSGSISAALKNTINYAENPHKTNDGVLVLGYECAPALAVSEFMLSKTRYEQLTGRNQGKNDVTGYQMRQSFKPGEITPEEALEIGRDTAMRFTKGRHQFIVAVHTNTNCIHRHMFFNSVTLDCNRKFKDFKFSALALRKISDHICAEHGLSVIENPGPSKGRDYAKYMQERKPPTARDNLQVLIDANLVIGQSFGEFLVKLKHAGCEIKTGKHTSVKLLGGKKNIRFDSLEPDYTEVEIRERLSGTRNVVPKAKLSVPATHTRTSEAPNLMVDIQAKIRLGYGEGYEHWARIFNLKQAAKTLIFLKENGIDSYADLKEKSYAMSADFSRLSHEIRDIEIKQKDIAELQKQIGTYIKTRAVYETYRKGGQKQKYYDEHTTDIILHRAAKKYFNEQGLKGTLPSIATLKQEWATFESEEKLLYKKYHEVKPRNKELQTALLNADNLLGTRQIPQLEHQTTRKSHNNDER